MRPGTGTGQEGGGLWLALVLIVVISGLFLALHFHQSPDSLRTMVDALKGSDDTPGAVQTPAAARSDRIIECTAADGSTFHTNALRCEDADLDNRVTEIPARPAMVNPDAGRNCLDPATPHQFRPACAEPFRAAMNLEADLAAAPNALDAPELDEYCDLIAQGVHAGCPANSAVFCYLSLCQQRAQAPVRP